MRWKTLEIPAPIGDLLLAYPANFSSSGFLHFVVAAASLFLLLVSLGLDFCPASSSQEVGSDGVDFDLNSFDLRVCFLLPLIWI